MDGHTVIGLRRVAVIEVAPSLMQAARIEIIPAGNGRRTDNDRKGRKVNYPSPCAPMNARRDDPDVAPYFDDREAARPDSRNHGMRRSKAIARSEDAPRRNADGSGTAETEARPTSIS